MPRLKGFSRPSKRKGRLAATRRPEISHLASDDMGITTEDAQVQFLRARFLVSPSLARSVASLMWGQA